MLNLPTRTEKPRSRGLTVVNDMGMPLEYARDWAKTFEYYVDIVKLGIGSALVRPLLWLKAHTYIDRGIPVYFGGTLFEMFVAQGQADSYAQWLEDLGITHVEVSCGTIELSLERRCEYVRRFVDEGLTVLGEVGTKQKDSTMPPSQWVDEVGALLEAGAWKVILEGRDSGTAGIFDREGRIRWDVVEAVVDAHGLKNVIIECPGEKAQCEIINRYGANVSFGNVAPDRVLVLEAQRVGLRYETFGTVPVPPDEAYRLKLAMERGKAALGSTA